MKVSSRCHSECFTESQSRTHVCPVNGQEYRPVSLKTMLHHIKSPWEWMEKQQGYYFCDDPDCEVVYFGEDNSVINKSELRTVVGIKARQPGALTCYCFGVSNLDTQQYPAIRDYIVDKTKAGLCSCDTSNPSGHCCLKNFPVTEKANH